jgi:hypothetical protein
MEQVTMTWSAYFAKVYVFRLFCGISVGRGAKTTEPIATKVWFNLNLIVYVSEKISRFNPIHSVMMQLFDPGSAGKNHYSAKMTSQQVLPSIS